jgi:hypothetical protein
MRIPLGFVGDSPGTEGNAMAPISSLDRVGRSRVAMRGL